MISFTNKLIILSVIVSIISGGCGVIGVVWLFGDEDRKDKCTCPDYDFIDQHPICNPSWQK